MNNSIDGLLQREILYWPANLIFCSIFSVSPYCTNFAMKPGFEIRISRPSRPCSPFNQGTNQCRSRTGQVANFAKRDNSILIYTPNCCRSDIEFNRLYTVYLFEGTFSKFMYEAKTYALHIIISSDNFKTNQRF